MRSTPPIEVGKITWRPDHLSLHLYDFIVSNSGTALLASQTCWVCVDCCGQSPDDLGKSIMSRRTDLWKGDEGPDVPTGGVTETHLGSHAKWRGNPTQPNPSLAAEGGLRLSGDNFLLPLPPYGGGSEGTRCWDLASPIAGRNCLNVRESIYVDQYHTQTRPSGDGVLLVM